jgi:hypothetical protein
MVVQSLIAKEVIKKGLKSSREFSVSQLGYDFVGLFIRLAFFLLMGVLVQSYFTATIAGGNWLNSVAGFFNIKFPATLPEWVVKLFTTGYNGIAFWQILQISAIVLVLIEYTQYDRMLKEQNQKPNVTTTAVFLMLGLGLSLMVFPQTIQKLKERSILNQ